MIAAKKSSIRLLREDVEFTVCMMLQHPNVVANVLNPTSLITARESAL
jgi:hypothetical protein